MDSEFALDVLFYALWCWAAYALIMGSFMYHGREVKSQITRGHLIVAFLFSCGGVYSFIFAFIRSVLMHGLVFPVSWNTGTGIIPPR